MKKLLFVMALIAPISIFGLTGCQSLPTGSEPMQLSEKEQFMRDCRNEHKAADKGLGWGTAVGAVLGGVLGKGNKKVKTAVIAGGLGALGGYAVGRSTETQYCKTQWRIREEGLEDQINVFMTDDGKIHIDSYGALLFGVNSAQVNPAFGAIAVEVGKLAQTAPGSVVQIDGHTDSTGTNAHNQNLSEQRAYAVASIVRSNTRNHVEARGFGETRPIASNANTQGREQNRRVEITIQLQRQ